MKYVIINEEKIPQHSLDQTFTYDEVKDYPNLAVLVDEPYVVLDVDDEDQAVALITVLEKMKVKSKIMRTKRGCHFWFKSRVPLINGIKLNTPITIKVDVKSWGKKSLATVKLKGVEREWLFDEDDVDEIPYWLYPFKLKKDLFGLKEGDGRDDGLFTYIIPLLKAKFTKSQIYTVFNIINKYLFEKPLLQREVDKMFEDNEIFDETVAFFDKKLFLHHEFAMWLKQNFPIEYYNGQLYLYGNGLYSPRTLKIEELMIKKIPRLNTGQRREVLNYLELVSNDSKVPLCPEQINTLSGMIDLRTRKISSHSEKIFSTNQIQSYYNPGHKDKHVDKFLTDVANGDKQIRKLLEQLIGYTLLGDCRFQKAFILVGQGANGKSIFLKMLSDFLGEDNISSVPLEKLNDKFETAELVGKLANIGDDISSDLLSDSSIFKKLVSGERLTVQRKFGHPFQFTNSAKLIFSANNLPPASDKSYGLQRRLVIVPFLNVFKKDHPDYNPNILTKLTTESAKMYLLNIAVDSLIELLEENQFVDSEKVTDMIETYEKENNNVLQWFEQEPEMLEVDLAHVYRNYCLFCATNNTTPYKKSKWTAELLHRFPQFRIKNTTKEGRFSQVFTEEKKRH